MMRGKNARQALHACLNPASVERGEIERVGQDRHDEANELLDHIHRELVWLLRNRRNIAFRRVFGHRCGNSGELLAKEAPRIGKSEITAENSYDDLIMSFEKFFNQAGPSGLFEIGFPPTAVTCAQLCLLYLFSRHRSPALWIDCFSKDIATAHSCFSHSLVAQIASKHGSGNDTRHLKYSRCKSLRGLRRILLNAVKELRMSIDEDDEQLVPPLTLVCLDGLFSLFPRPDPFQTLQDALKHRDSFFHELQSFAKSYRIVIAVSQLKQL